MGDERQHRRVDADHGRRGARPGVSAGRDADVGLSTAAIGPATTCSPKASSASICKTGQRKWHFQLVHHPLWNYDMSSAAILADITVNGRADQGRRRAGQAGVPVRVRSRHRPAGVADRRAAGAAVRRARREDEPDAAVPDQAAGVRAQHAQGARRPDRLHAGAARAGARRTSSATRSAPWMYNPPVLGDVNGMLGAINMGNADRRHQLAGRRLRSRDAHRLRATRTTSASRRRRWCRRRRTSRTSATCPASPGGRSRKCSDPATAARPIRRARSAQAARSGGAAPARAAGGRAAAAHRPSAAAPAGGLHRRRPVDSQAAVRHDLRGQSRSRRDRRGRCRTATRRTTCAIIPRSKG